MFAILSNIVSLTSKNVNIKLPDVLMKELIIKQEYKMNIHIHKSYKNHSRVNFIILEMIILVRYVNSNYYHNSANCEKSVKLGTTNKQYVTVKNKGRPKLGLHWGLGRSPKSIMADFFFRTCPSNTSLDGKFYADLTKVARS